jgi:hypothetical protein
MCNIFSKSFISPEIAASPCTGLLNSLMMTVLLAQVHGLYCLEFCDVWLH